MDASREIVARPSALLGIKITLGLLDFLPTMLDPAYMENTPCLSGFGRLSCLGVIAATGSPCPSRRHSVLEKEECILV